MLHAVILAGGGGSRLWPLSHPHLPKQFLSLLGDRSLLQETVLRLESLVPPERIVIVTSSDYEPLVHSQLLQILGVAGDRVRIITEPVRRNTAVAIGLAALHLLHNDPDALMLVLPADHWINQRRKFVALVQCSLGWAEQEALVTFGILPTRPETGYGYIQRGEPCVKRTHLSEAYHVDRFVEKPPLTTAQHYLSCGAYYWNAGIFLWKATRILQEIETFLPSLASGLQELRHSVASHDTTALASVYAQLEPISIDTGVLEKSSRIIVIPTDMGWSDLGEWTAIHRLSPHDARGNAVRGQAVLQDSDNSFIYSSHRPIAGVGLKDLVVVETDGAVLVSSRERVQEVKLIGEQVPFPQVKPLSPSPPVERPWGAYMILEEGSGYKVKRLSIFPGASISLQFHNYRNEHWVVVQGTARATKGTEEIVLQTNESTYVSQGTVHRLANLGANLLEVIEVQTGSYLGEDDIVRLTPSH